MNRGRGRAKSRTGTKKTGRYRNTRAVLPVSGAAAKKAAEETVEEDNANNPTVPVPPPGTVPDPVAEPPEILGPPFWYYDMPGGLMTPGFVYEFFMTFNITYMLLGGPAYSSNKGKFYGFASQEYRVILYTDDYDVTPAGRKSRQIFAIKPDVDGWIEFTFPEILLGGTGVGWPTLSLMVREYRVTTPTEIEFRIASTDLPSYGEVVFPEKGQMVYNERDRFGVDVEDQLAGIGSRPGQDIEIEGTKYMTTDGFSGGYSGGLGYTGTWCRPSVNMRPAGSRDGDTIKLTFHTPEPSSSPYSFKWWGSDSDPYTGDDAYGNQQTGSTTTNSRDYVRQPAPHNKTLFEGVNLFLTPVKYSTVG